MSEGNDIRCVNYEFCGNDRVPGMGSECCMGCGSWFKGGFRWDKLTIVDSTTECDVCMNVCARKLLFPANCGHSFCLPCSRQILYYNESTYFLSPVTYGCPPCPNGCENPVRGKQCDCIEYDSVQNAWEQANPDDFTRWNDAQNASIDHGETNEIYGRGACPLCRKKYSR